MPITLTLSSLLLAADLGVIGTHNGFSERASPAMTYVGCYSSSDGLTNRTSYVYQSFGWCLNECIKTDAAAFALRGHDCLCGTKLPPPSAMVPKGQCNQACPGFSSDICGSDNLYSVYTTGLGGTIAVNESSTTSTSSASTTSKTNSPAISNQSTDGADDTQKRHSNVALIAGIVGGACGGAALVGGAFFFFWRSRKKRNAQTRVDDTDGYYGDGDFCQEASRADSRLDGSYLAECRKVNGSIDDFHDYSRRVLQKDENQR
ncbi:hypothetical protein N7467_001458 [Penicillium canescens]|nr:hypothetical protein N7467_001458 [Penicillium canescens]